MTWQLGAFTILALALGAGFFWYERARPDARIVALVATLAAFAALGRIAFAALPNVKPTTDIVLISGYALGGAPGFAIGAITGLASNFFFGQGPWTPWQMVAWGATGLFGAGLAVLTRERIGRWPLAVVCGVVGYAFAAFQDVGDWVTYSDHSAAQLRVYVIKGTGFDIVHAVGCFAFAVAFAPALMRSVQRFARRLQVTWIPLTPAAVAVVIALAVGAAGTGMLAPSSAAAARPGGYLLSAQHRDGGFGSSPGAPSSSLYAGWAALGLAAQGFNPQDVSRGGRSLLAYIRAAAGRDTDTGSIERTILVTRAAGVSPRRFGGRDLVTALTHHVRADGSLSDQVNLTAFGVLALRAARAPLPHRMLHWLGAQQDADGGFNFATRGGASDVDDTGAALEALALAGRSAAGVRHRAVAFLRAQQDRDGGFPADTGGESNAQSTAWAVQGLLAAHVEPSSLHRRGAVSPLAFLRSLTDGDGHVHYSRTSDQTPVWVTAQAVMALARKPLPIAPVRRRHRSSAASSSGGGPAAGPSSGGAGGSGGVVGGARVARGTGAGATASRSAGAAPGRSRGSSSAHGPGRPGAGAAVAAVLAGGPDLDRLAATAGLIAALALAPVGQG